MRYSLILLALVPALAGATDIQLTWNVGTGGDPTNPTAAYAVWSCNNVPASCPFATGADLTNPAWQDMTSVLAATACPDGLHCSTIVSIPTPAVGELASWCFALQSVCSDATMTGGAVPVCLQVPGPPPPTTVPTTTTTTSTTTTTLGLCSVPTLTDVTVLP